MGRGSVVVMDDDADLTAFVSDVLGGAGFTVFAAHDGKSGIETVVRVLPELVLVDVLMPIVQGYDVCRYLRHLEGLNRLKVVMLSSLAQDGDRRWALDAGADAYLTKPVTADDLLRAVRGLLGAPAVSEDGGAESATLRKIARLPKSP